MAFETKTRIENRAGKERRGHKRVQGGARKSLGRGRLDEKGFGDQNGCKECDKKRVAVFPHLRVRVLLRVPVRQVPAQSQLIPVRALIRVRARIPVQARIAVRVRPHIPIAQLLQ